jgi:hypothetical protein
VIVPLFRSSWNLHCRATFECIGCFVSGVFLRLTYRTSRNGLDNRDGDGVTIYVATIQPYSDPLFGSTLLLLITNFFRVCIRFIKRSHRRIHLRFVCMLHLDEFMMFLDPNPLQVHALWITISVAFLLYAITCIVLASRKLYVFIKKLGPQVSLPQLTLESSVCSILY